MVAVTGGARGIGQAIATELADRGARVAIGDVGVEASTSPLAAVDAVRQYPLDVTDEQSFEAFLASVTADLGPIDILINNAGVMWVGPFDAEPAKAAEKVIAVNLLGVIRGVRLAAPAMRARGRGQIITIASAASRLAPPGESTYAASKHGVLGYLTGVREELRGSGVTLSVVMPTVVETELAVGTSAGSVRRLAPSDIADAVIDTIGRRRFQVWVPSSVGPLVAVTGILPQRLRDEVLRRTVPNQVAAVKDSDSRAEYEHTIDDDRT
ncbi:putative oxidoreductase [Gordonia effusa NBRC 100432]|uniref:Putative oxidoreductase n=1 Tax=Gordonia effusa NBRC 100432 TaxID=1077974 RepID=H0R6K4_9ACTN|nr:putative oxidoreductase [Gordonia effusa NBRC 100432]